MKVNKDKYGQVRITIPQRLCDILNIDGGEDMDFRFIRECPHYDHSGACKAHGLIKLFEVVVEE